MARRHELAVTLWAGPTVKMSHGSVSSILQGKCSTGRLTIPLNLQKELLAAEGIVFTNGEVRSCKHFGGSRTGSSRSETSRSAYLKPKRGRRRIKLPSNS
ncbi:MAG: hypothetical protein IPP63_04985 [Chloracidobacterium sp.]|nr:hypothetical protein [Chloracidobacterium sp.]